MDKDTLPIIISFSFGNPSIRLVCKLWRKTYQDLHKRKAFFAPLIRNKSLLEYFKRFPSCFNHHSIISIFKYDRDDLFPFVQGYNLNSENIKMCITNDSKKIFKSLDTNFNIPDLMEIICCYAVGCLRVLLEKALPIGVRQEMKKGKYSGQITTEVILWGILTRNREFILSENVVKKIERSHVIFALIHDEGIFTSLKNISIKITGKHQAFWFMNAISDYEDNIKREDILRKIRDAKRKI